MQITNLTLAFAVLESKQLLENSTVQKVQELENSWLKIKLRTKQGSRELVLTPQIFFFSSYSMPAKKLSSGFSAFLRKHLENKKILQVQQYSFDRIVFFEFADFFLVLELFAKGNIVLADKEMKILGVLRTEHWKDRTLKKGVFYKHPSSKGINPLEISLEEFSRLAQTESETVKFLVRSLNIAPIIAEEALFESGIEKGIQAKLLSAGELLKLLEKIKALYSIEESRLHPVLVEKDSEKIILPFEIKSSETEKKFPSLNSAFEEFFSKEFFSMPEKSVSAAFEKKLLELQKSLEMQISSKEKLLEKASVETKKGEAVFSHYRELQSAFEILKHARENNESTKDIMYKLSSLGIVKSFDLKNRKLIVELS